uniref:Uncharacterized protein n=1 Tax=Avena sativa TaxID=4498 RepID=A0ACD5V7Y3_AVESA
MDGGVALKAADGMPLTDGGLQKPDALAMKMSKEARSLANRFPGSARAQLCYLLVQLQYMRSLPRNLNMSKGVKRLVNSARSAAQAFPNSVLIAMFHAKLLLLSGRLDLAAAECHRAIYLEDVTDPEEECVPPGSIEGHDLQARLSSVAGDFELLLKKIIESAEKCWENSLTTDIKRRFLLVKISALQNEYAKVDKSPGSNIQSALNFIKQNDSWRFWMCPLCSSNKRHSTSSLLMDHMHKKHARIFLPRLKSVISSTLDSDSDGLCHGMSFTQDKDNHDIIQFEERSGLFRWLFSAAIRGEKARPFDKIAQENRTQGTELLEIMKQKMASLPTEKSTTYESPMLDEIREIWLQFLKSTVFDYGKILLTLARTLLWSEFKEHMAGVLKDGCQNITADDVDDAFSTWSNADTQKMKEDVSYPTESQKPTNVSVDQEAVGILNLDLNFSDINLMDIALKALWSLNHFSHELIKAENPCSKNNHDGPCVGDIVHRAFCSWWKGEYPREELASLAKAVHKILDAAAFQKGNLFYIYCLLVFLSLILLVIMEHSILA